MMEPQAERQAQPTHEERLRGIRNRLLVDPNGMAYRLNQTALRQAEYYLLRCPSMSDNDILLLVCNIEEVIEVDRL